MRSIAHRGNTQGRNESLENHPNYISNAIHQGYDAEIDVWFLDGLDLGHDDPQYSIELDYLLGFGEQLWIHCKNLEALHMLSEFPELNVFWHQKDDYTLTSKNFIWTYPKKQVTLNSVLVIQDATKYTGPECYGLCADNFE